MDRDPATVDVTLYDCVQCGTAMTYHGDGCDSMVVHVDSERLWTGCGVSTAPYETEHYSECGGCAPPAQFAATIDLSPSVAPERVKRAIHGATNRYRTDRNRSTLNYSEHLCAIALRHSWDMAMREYFSHHSSEGEGPADRYRDHDHSDRSNGENIAVQQPGPTISAAALADRIVDGWVDCEGHQENILEDQLGTESVYVYITTDGAVYATQNFK